MNWTGRLLGALFGFLLFGPLGAILGFFAGSIFDRGITTSFGQSHSIQTAFFNNTFAVMGHVAKANGRVTEKQIQFARTMMQRMGLHGDRRIIAMQQFNLGKQPDFDLNHALDQLRQLCPSQQLLRMFIELQVQTAYADNVPSANTKRLLQNISLHLGLGHIDFNHIEAMLYGQWQQQSSHQQHYQRSQPRTSINETYDILGVNSSATDAEVKKAYRRKMNENHPDKLIAKGLPKDMIELATQKTQQIKAAYEQIKRHRGMK